MPDNANALCFIDSNVWLYAFVVSDNREKSATASTLISESLPAISTQVINEVCINLIRKANFNEEQIRNLVASFYSKYRVLYPSESMIENASHLRERYSFSYWDSGIVAAALEAQVTVLYSEDMHAGLVVNDKLRIINPFC